MSEIARLGAGSMVLGITGTDGVTYNLDDMSNMVQGMTFSRTLNINSAAAEITGVQYQSIANALTYIGTQTPVPSATNRWALLVSGTLAENIDLGNMAYIHIVGTGNALLSGTIDNSSTTITDLNQIPQYLGLIPWAIYNCSISDLSLSHTAMSAFVNCRITGGTSSNYPVIFVYGGTITGGTFSAGFDYLCGCFISGGTFGDSNMSSSNTLYMSDNAVTGGTFNNAYAFATSFVEMFSSKIVINAGGNFKCCVFTKYFDFRCVNNCKY
jgi:hypothetical protein